MTMPKVSVQILTYGNSDIERIMVERLRDSLFAVTYPKDSWCLVVVDNPSPRGNMREYLHSDWVSESGKRLPHTMVIAHDVNDGFAGGHVSALVESKKWGADYVFLLNQDSVVDANFLTESVAVAETCPNTAVLQSRVMLDQDPDRLNSVGNAMHYLGFSFSIDNGARYQNAFVPSLPIFCASGAAVLVRMTAIECIGLFAPEYFLYHEDVDLSWRARLAGYDIAVVQNSVVYHHYEFSRSITKMYVMERNRLLTNFINYELGTLCALAPMILLMEVGTFGFSILSGWWKEKLRAWLFFFNISTWKFIVRRRKVLSRYRIVRDRDLFPLMCSVVVNQEVNNPLLLRVVNPMMTMYFRFICWVL